MKGAFLVSADSQLFLKVRDVLAQLGAATATDGGVVQLKDELGNLFTVFRDVPPSTDWEWREGPLSMESGEPAPAMEAATACWIECRSEEAFSALVRHIAVELQQPSSVIDGDGVVWSAQKVDPDRIRL